eukprot:UN3240
MKNPRTSPPAAGSPLPLGGIRAMLDTKREAGRVAARPASLPTSQISYEALRTPTHAAIQDEHGMWDACACDCTTARNPCKPDAEPERGAEMHGLDAACTSADSVHLAVRLPARWTRNVPVQDKSRPLQHGTVRLVRLPEVARVLFVGDGEDDGEGRGEGARGRSNGFLNGWSSSTSLPSAILCQRSLLSPTFSTTSFRRLSWAKI